MATKTRKSTKSSDRRDIYAEVTAQVTAALEQGFVPWHKPWSGPQRSISAHTNLVSKKAYRGVNPFLLEIASMLNCWESPFWVTYRQAKALGGQVREGSVGTLVTFWKPTVFTKTDEATGEEKKVPSFFLKHYTVFNVEQCDGLDEKLPAVEPQPEVPEFSRIEAAEAVVNNMPKRPKTLHNGGDRAFYAPTQDSVHLPKPEHFERPEAYYSTRIHEYAHATGHADRLGRVKDWTHFGSEPYGKEELVAEMTAAMVCGVIGIGTKTVDDSAAYVQAWLRNLNEPQNVKLVIQAAGQAQKAADFILGVTHEEKEES